MVINGDSLLLIVIDDYKWLLIVTKCYALLLIGINGY